jgi:hypothetical protein
MAWSIFTQGGGAQVAVGWAHQLLKLIGAPDTPGNVEFIYQWEKAEGGGGKYNPLNQGPVAGKPNLTTTGSQYGGGAADFASWDAGLQGAATYLSYSQYAGVLNGLKNNNPVAARQALWASPWAASHYGYGKNWPNVAVPGGTPILPGTGVGSSDTGTAGTPATTVGLTADEKAQCAWVVHAPVAGDTCLMKKTQLRETLGVLLMTGGTGLILFGIAVLVAFSFKSSKAGQAAGKAVGAAAGFVPGGTAVKAAGATARASQAAKSGGKKKSGLKPGLPLDSETTRVQNRVVNRD